MIPAVYTIRLFTCLAALTMTVLILFTKSDQSRHGLRGRKHAALRHGKSDSPRCIRHSQKLPLMKDRKISVPRTEPGTEIISLFLIILPDLLIDLKLFGCDCKAPPIFGITKRGRLLIRPRTTQQLIPVPEQEDRREKHIDHTALFAGR